MGLFDLFRRIFRGRPKPPKARLLSKIVGHRGIAAGDLKARQEAARKHSEWIRGGRVGLEPPEPYTEEERLKHRQLGSAQAMGFVYDQEPLFVHSSNVAMGQYFLPDKKLMLEFLDGSAYTYDNVTEDEAIEFVQYASKGGFVWDRLRIRGTKKGHQKPYRKIRFGTVSMAKLRRLFPPKPPALPPRPTVSQERIATMSVPVQRGASPKAPVWTYNGHKVQANTKSEARAWFNQNLGKLPPGAAIERAA